MNLTNPRLYGGPLDELVPVGPIVVGLRLAPSTEVGAVRLLRAGTVVPFERDADGMLAVSVPEVTDFEVVAVDVVGKDA